MAFTLTDQARKEANLRVLQRQDASVVDILGSATHVVLYEFASPSWQKLDVEGSLFLVKKRDVPRFRLLVLNRNSNENYQVDITPSFQVQEKDPYLMFRKPNGSIQGIWFHDGSERQEMATLLQKVVQSLAVDPDAAAAALLSPLTISSNDSQQQQQQPPTPPVHRPSPRTTPQQQRRSSSTGGTFVSSGTAAATESPVLDKKSLQLALLSLLHDDRFLDLIHAQYLKVAHARANKKSDINNNNNHG